MPAVAYRRLVYAVPAVLGSGAAHCVHAMKMAAALGDRVTDLVMVVRQGQTGQNLSEEFSLRRAPFLSESGTSRVLPFALHFACTVLRLSRPGDRVLTRHLPTSLIACLAGRETVLELHSPLVTRRERLMFRILSRLPGFKGLVTISAALKRRFVSDFGERISDRIHVMADGADARDNGNPRFADAAEPLVGYVGSFLPGKGVELILEVAALLPEVRFVLVGSYEEQVAAGVPANVSLVGQVSHQAAQKWVDRFAVALLPNQRSVLVSGGRADIGAYTSPLKMFEYMAAGKAILASRLPVLEEVLEDGRNCLLASPECADEWARQLMRLLRDNTLRAMLGQNALTDLVDHYTWEARAQRLLDTFAWNGPAAKLP